MIRAASVACLLVAALFWVAPTSAFDSSQYSRSAAAAVKSDSQSYNAPYLPSCSVDPDLGGSCTFYVYNNGTTTQTYTLTRQTNPSSIVTSFDVDSTGTSTGTAKTVGQKTTVSVSITANDCTPSCGTKTVEWMIVGTNANVLDWREEHVVLTVVFA